MAKRGGGSDQKVATNTGGYLPVCGVNAGKAILVQLVNIDDDLALSVTRIPTVDG